MSHQFVYKAGELDKDSGSQKLHQNPESVRQVGERTARESRGRAVDVLRTSSLIPTKEMIERIHLPQKLITPQQVQIASDHKFLETLAGRTVNIYDEKTDSEIKAEVKEVISNPAKPEEVKLKVSCIDADGHIAEKEVYALSVVVRNNISQKKNKPAASGKSEVFEMSDFGAEEVQEAVKKAAPKPPPVPKETPEARENPPIPFKDVFSPRNKPGYQPPEQPKRESNPFNDFMNTPQPPNSQAGGRRAA